MLINHVFLRKQPLQCQRLGSLISASTVCILFVLCPIPYIPVVRLISVHWLPIRDSPISCPWPRTFCLERASVRKAALAMDSHLVQKTLEHAGCFHRQRPWDANRLLKNNCWPKEDSNKRRVRGKEKEKDNREEGRWMIHSPAACGSPYLLRGSPRKGGDTEDSILVLSILMVHTQLGRSRITIVINE